MGRRKSMIAAALLCLLSIGYTQVTPAEAATLQLEPAEIDVGLFYHGADVKVSAEVAPCDGAVVVMEAGAEELTFNRKGREAGIWLNVAQITISNVPRVYLMGSSKSLDQICSQATQRELGLGIASLRDRVKIDSEKPLVGSELDEFLDLKKKAGVYSQDVPVSLTPVAGDREALSATLSIPATVPPGEYNVVLLSFVNGQPVRKWTTSLVIRRVGLANLLTTLAYDRAAVYGVLAIAIAIVVGIVMGMIFHSRPGSGH